ncbi:hypothetical protein [Streptomyces sp. NPDC007856]
MRSRLSRASRIRVQDSWESGALWLNGSVPESEDQPGNVAVVARAY